MKKKILAFLLILVMAASLVYGCGLISVDNERDLAQVIATVGDEQYKDEITKKDLVSLYVSQGSTYVQNYNLTVGQTMKVLLEQLINNRILVQKGVNVLKEHNPLLTGTMSYYLTEGLVDGKKKSERLRELVGEDAYITALSNMYKYETETLDSYENQVISDWATPIPTNAPTAEPTPTATPTPRPTKIPDVVPSEIPQTVPNPEPTSKSRIEALNRFKVDLEGEKMTYEEFKEDSLVANLENQILIQYQESLYSTISVPLADLQGRYDFMKLTQEQQSSTDLTSYITKLTGATADTFILCNPVNGYGYVKNLLIGFDSALAADLAEAQSKELSDDQYWAIRKTLLNDVTVKYLSENVTEKVDYADINTFYATEIITNFGGTLVNDVYGTNDIDGKNDVYVNNTVSDENLDKFEDLIFKYGTDPGMFNNMIDYLSSPKPEIGTAEKYVTEFAEAARAVVDAGIGSYTIVGTDFGWHVIICTDKIEAGVIDHINETEYNNITTALLTTKYDSLPKNITSTFTYKLYNVMRNGIKGTIYSTKATQIIDEYESKITRFEDRYKDLVALA